MALIQLTASGQGGSDGFIGVTAAVPTENPIKGGQVHMASSIFSTHLKAEAHCHEALLPVEPRHWPFDLELTPDGKLGRLA